MSCGIHNETPEVNLVHRPKFGNQNSSTKPALLSFPKVVTIHSLANYRCGEFQEGRMQWEGGSNVCLYLLPTAPEKKNQLEQLCKFQELRVARQGTNWLRERREEQHGFTLSTWDGLCIDQEDEVSVGSCLLSAYPLLVCFNRKQMEYFRKA